MPNFKDMSPEQLREISSKGGKARQKLNQMTFEDVVKDEMTYDDLKELYRGMLASGKKGNVKAVETLLRYLDKAEKPTSLDDFIDEE